MEKSSSKFARVSGVVFSILFVFTMVMSIILINIDFSLFNVNFYKSVLNQQMTYERFPGLLAGQIIKYLTYDPCVDNPFSCSRPNPAFLSCVGLAIGNQRVDTLTLGESLLSPYEKEIINPASINILRIPLAVFPKGISCFFLIT